MSRTKLSFLSWKALESFISLAVMLGATILANLIVFYVVKDPATQHLLAIRLFFPSYFTLGTILVVTMLVHAYFAAKKEDSLKGDVILPEKLANATTCLLRNPNCTYDIFFSFLRKRLFIDGCDLLCALRLKRESARGGVLKRVGKFAHLMSIGASDQHAMRMISELEKHFSEEDIDRFEGLVLEKYNI